MIYVENENIENTINLQELFTFMSYVLTFVASKSSKPVTEYFLQEAMAILKRHGIVRTCEFSWLSPDRAVDIGLSDFPPSKTFPDLRSLADHEEIDFFVTAIEKRRKTLLMADMESTIIKNEMLDELAEYADVQDKVAQITANAMEGKIDFHAAIHERAGLLKGLSADLLSETLSKIEFNDGAEKMISVMRKHGCNCVLISGGFTFYTSRVAAKLGFNNHHANDLEVLDGIITGKVRDPILDKHEKLAHLKHYRNEMHIPAEEVMAIGDGANDLLMLHEADFGIGYKPKEAVAKEIYNIIRHGDFTAALYAQGYNDDHLLT